MRLSRFACEKGQSLVFTVVAVTGVMGMTALVLDVGSWFRSQRNLQQVADAAALAGAQALPNDTSAAMSQAQAYATKNGFTLAASGITISSTVRPNDTIKVRVTRVAPSFFSKVIGIDGANVAANATATSENLSEARYVAPIAVDYQHQLLNCSKGGKSVTCNPTYGVETTLNLVDLKSGGSSGAGNFGLVDLTNSNGSVGSTDLADWIEYGYGDSLPLGNYDGVPSTKYHDSQMRDALDIRSGDVLLFPVYDKITGPGSNAVYHVIGWVGFRVDSFDTQSQNGTLTGQFVRFIAQGLDSSDSTQADFGVKKVTLVG